MRPRYVHPISCFALKYGGKTPCCYLQFLLRNYIQHQGESPGRQSIDQPLFLFVKWIHDWTRVVRRQCMDDGTSPLYTTVLSSWLITPMLI